MALNNFLMFIVSSFSVFVWSADYGEHSQPLKQHFSNYYEQPEPKKEEWDNYRKDLVQNSRKLIDYLFQKKYNQSQVMHLQFDFDKIEKVLRDLLFIKKKYHYLFEPLFLAQGNINIYSGLKEHANYIYLLNKYGFMILYNQNGHSYIICSNEISNHDLGMNIVYGDLNNTFNDSNNASKSMTKNTESAEKEITPVDDDNFLIEQIKSLISKKPFSNKDVEKLSLLMKNKEFNKYDEKYLNDLIKLLKVFVITPSTFFQVNDKRLSLFLDNVLVDIVKFADTYRKKLENILLKNYYAINKINIKNYGIILGKLEEHNFYFKKNKKEMYLEYDPQRKNISKNNNIDNILMREAREIIDKVNSDNNIEKSACIISNAQLKKLELWVDKIRGKYELNYMLILLKSLVKNSITLHYSIRRKNIISFTEKLLKKISIIYNDNSHIERYILLGDYTQYSENENHQIILNKLEEFRFYIEKNIEGNRIVYKPITVINKKKTKKRKITAVNKIGKKRKRENTPNDKNLNHDSRQINNDNNDSDDYQENHVNKKPKIIVNKFTNTHSKKIKKKLSIIADRYFEEHYLAFPYFSHNNVNQHNKGLGDATYRFLSLAHLFDDKLKSNSSLDNHLIKSSKYRDKYIEIELLYTGAEYSPDTDFLSIVMAGRGLNAFVPKPEINSFVVLVLSTEQYKNDKKYYDLLLQKGYRLLLIHKIRTGLGELKKDELGLVTSRRIAGFFLAQQLKSPNFIMMDDNLDGIFLSPHLIKDGFASSWLSIVDVLKNAAQPNGLSLLSIHSYRPYHDPMPPTALTLEVEKGEYGYKLFYFDLLELNKDQKLKDATYLFPPLVSIWGEDFYLYNLLGLREKYFGTIDRKGMVMSRHFSNPNACLKSLKSVGRLAEGWLEDQLMKEYFANVNDNTLKDTYKLMQKTVEKNINQRIKEQERIMAFDLSEKTAIAAGKFKKWKNQPSWFLSSALDYKWRPTDLAGQLFNSTLPSILEENDLGFLFTHQHQALRSLLLSEENNLSDTGYFEMATGSGKSLIINTLIAAMLEDLNDETNIALLVPTRDLVHQAYEAIIKFNELNEEGNHLHINLRRVIAVDSNHVRQQYLLLNQKLNTGGYLIIFCNDSFKQQLADTQNVSLINSLQAVIVDELHKANKALLESLVSLQKKQGTLLYGFSATPGTKAKYFDKQLYKYTRERGVAEGILAPWQTHIIGQSLFRDVINENLKAMPSPLDDPKAFASFLVNADSAYDGVPFLEKKGLIFVPPKRKSATQSTANKLVSSLQRYLPRIKIAEVSSEMAARANKNAIKSFKDARQNTNILVAIDMLTVGFDADVDYIVIDRNITNQDKLIQIFGRALRKGKNGKVAQIFVQKNTFERFKSIINSWVPHLPPQKWRSYPRFSRESLDMH